MVRFYSRVAWRVAAADRFLKAAGVIPRSDENRVDRLACLNLILKQERIRFASRDVLSCVVFVW